MPRYSYLIFTRPVAGREEEFNRWYTHQHLPDLLRVPGVVGAQRFRLAAEQADAPGSYLAVYDIDSDDIQRTLADIESRAGSAAMPLSEALDMERVTTFVYEAITERQARRS
jgi:hypothetical protein